MHERVLPPQSQELLAKLARLSTSALQGWCLAGGTGLALQLGHRVSDDFDFFRTDQLDREGLHRVFSRHCTYETLQETAGSLTIIAESVKLSFFSVPDPFVFPGVPYRFFLLADVREIALMKLIAISGRGARKDFVDLYAILRKGPMSLQDYFDRLPAKYGAGRSNAYHILKSLTYFVDAEREPLPTMLEPWRWQDCKTFLVRQAHAIVLP